MVKKGEEVKITIRLNVSGKEQVVTSSSDVKEFLYVIHFVGWQDQRPYW